MIKLAVQNTSLATKYRPQVWEDVMGQDTVKQILQHQITTKTFKQGYLFCGKFGSGKTTSARIFARMINEGAHDIIEIDAATYNGVEQMRLISEEARKKPLVGKYKIFIIDEAHMITQAGGNAFLKLLEEPPATAIFILCTTDPQKMLNTILSRVQRYDFTSIAQDKIVARLRYIADQEGIDVDDASLAYLAKSSTGSMRNAISALDKCSSLKDKLTLQDVTSVLATVGYEEHFTLLSGMIQKDSAKVFSTLHQSYNAGKDMKQYISEFMWTVCDVCNYLIFKSFDYISIPKLSNYESFMNTLSLDSCLPILEWAKNLNALIRNEPNPYNMIQVEVMLWLQR